MMSDDLSIDPKVIPNSVLRRLIREIQHEDQCELCRSKYNRFHNRHFRDGSHMRHHDE